MGLLGSGPNQVSTNGDLGNMAFQDSASVRITNLLLDGSASFGSSAPTIASATTISPNTAIVFISGTAAIATITVPTSITGGGQITLIPTGIFTTTTGGNIALASTAVVSKSMIMTYDATTTKWYPSY